jgi:GntR family transcriptional repressor for pyruvate dehydrogenase complex
MKTEEIKKANLPEKFIERIIELLKIGKLKPGDKLPSMRVLSERMKIGQSSVREALKQLQIIGVVKTEHGKGTYISEKIKINSLSKAMGYLLTLQEPNILYLIETRKIIERGTVILAAERASEGEIEKLDQIIYKMKETIDDPESFARENVNFHLAIADASKNPILSLFFNSVYELFLQEQQAVAGVLDLKLKSIDYHIKILKAIKERNVKKAAEEMDAHLNAVEREILQVSKKQNQEEK